MSNLPPGFRPTQLTMASSISPEDTVVIVQNGFNKKLPVSYLLAAGQSGFSGASGISGFSGFNGSNGLDGEFAGIGLSGFSGISGFSGYSPILDIKPSYLIFSNENGKITELPNVTSTGETIELTCVNDSPQLCIKPEKGAIKSITATVNNNETSLTFQNNPYSNTTINSESKSGDLVINSSTYGKPTAEILRIKNAEQEIVLSKKLTTATPSKVEAGFNLPLGERPEIIKDGDVWRESEGVYIQAGKSLIGPLSSTANVTSWEKTELKLTVNNVTQSFGENTSNCVFFRRVGDSMECRIDLRQNKGVNGDTGEYLVNVPHNLTIDSDKINFMTENSFGSIGSGTLYDGIPNNITFQPRTGKHLAVIVNNRTWSSNNHNLNNSTLNLIGTFTVPIEEWK